MRSLSILGALVAVVAMSAISASSAFAVEDHLTAETYPATLTGTQHEGNGVFKTTAGSSECKQATLHGTISGPATTVTAVPTFSECTCIGVACVVDTNECHFLLHLKETTATADLTCPAGKEITLTNTKCQIHVKPQSSIGKIEVTNAGSGLTRDLTAHIELSSIHYTHTEGTGIGKCTTGTGSTGTLVGKSTITGETDPTGAAHIGIFLSQV